MYLVKRQDESDLYPSFLVKSYLEKAKTDKKYKVQPSGEYTKISRGNSSILIKYINIGE